VAYLVQCLKRLTEMNLHVPLIENQERLGKNDAC
jgi:hypothetical protein